MKKRTPVGGLATIKKISPEAICVGDKLMLIDNFRVPDYMTEPFRTRLITAVFFHEGEYDISIQMQRYHIISPCMMLLLNGRTVQYHSAERCPKATHIVLTPSVIDGSIPDHGDSIALFQSVLENPVISFKADYLPTVELYLASLRECLRHTNNPHRLAAAQNLTRAFFLCMPQLKKTPQVVKSHSEELMFKFLELLRNNFRSERTIGFYAVRLSISSKHLSKVVKQVSGRTVHDWVDEYVSTEAKALLCSTDMTVSQVGEALGFASQPLFTKYFRRATGLNPSDLRRNR